MAVSNRLGWQDPLPKRQRSEGTVRVFISAAEPSGDRIAAGLVEALKKRHPHWHFGGIVGPRLRALSVETVADISALSVMGLWEVLPKALSIWRLQRRIRRELMDWDAVITVDSSSFNRPLLRAMKRNGRPAIGIVSPQVWATRPHRAQLPDCRTRRSKEGRVFQAACEGQSC